MTGSTLLPMTSADVAPKNVVKSPPRRHDFSSHVGDNASRVGVRQFDNIGDEEQAPSTAQAVSPDANVTAALRDVALSAGGGRLFVQSLSVVGYLSMLGQGETQGERSFSQEASAAFVHPGESDASDSLAVATHISASPVQGEQEAMSAPSGVCSQGTRATATATDPADRVATSPAAAYLERKHFARRLVRLSGDTIFVRDFSLDANAALTVLNDIRSAWPEGRHAASAVLNGHTHSLA